MAYFNVKVLEPTLDMDHLSSSCDVGEKIARAARSQRRPVWLAF
jgi:hypothetical protein